MTETSAQQITFENHLQKRVMEIHFPEGFCIASEADIQSLRKAWTGNLKTWHSPYSCLFDLRRFEVQPHMQASFERMLKFFSGFFMKKILGFYEAESEAFALGNAAITFEKVCGYDEARKAIGLEKSGGLIRDLNDLRQRIQIENDFNAHVMDITFLAPTVLNSVADVEIFKSKLTNILMQWHSPYRILLNCSELSFSAEGVKEFEKLERFLKGFFCKGIVGYSPMQSKETYPFRTFRSRHLAAGALENEGLVSGNVANCSTRQKTD